MFRDNVAQQWLSTMTALNSDVFFGVKNELCTCRLILYAVSQSKCVRFRCLILCVVSKQVTQDACGGVKKCVSALPFDSLCGVEKFACAFAPVVQQWFPSNVSQQ